MDADDAQCDDEAMQEPTYKLIAFDPDGEINYEHPNVDYIGLLDAVEGLKQRKEGEPWTRPHDPFEDAPDPRDVGI